MDRAAALLALARELAEQSRRGSKLGRISLDSDLERDLGLDSLARVELLLRVERCFDASLPDRAVLEARTLRDILGAIRVDGGKKQRGPPLAAETSAQALAPGEVPERAETLVEVLQWHARSHPDRTHITLWLEEGRTAAISYGELLGQAQAVAGGLLRRGLEPGQTVALMLPTSAEYFSAFFGILLCGGVPVPLFPPERLDRLEEHVRRQAKIIANAQARTLIAADEEGRVGRLLKHLTPEPVLATTVGALRAGEAAEGVKPSACDTALLQYTSGSTGEPKGVILSHANILANIRAMAQANRIESTDVFVSWLPLYHDMGLIGAWLGSLFTAMRVVIMPPASFLLRPQRWLRVIHQERGTVSAAPNFSYDLCASKIGEADLRGLDLGSWRLALNGSEPVHASTIERFCARFTPHGFRRQAMTPVYGLAECSVGLTFPPPGRGPLIDRIKRREFDLTGRAIPAGKGEADAAAFVSCGSPLPGHEVRILDDAGHEVQEREEGRLQFRGPSATSGYYRNPEAAAGLFDGDWLDSGDRAYVSHGEVFLTGRAKDLIIKAGRNIHPQELERAVECLPGVRLGGAAAIGTADAASGTERLVIIAETRERQAQRLEALAGRVRGEVAALIGMPPDDVVLVRPHSVPKTPIGKIRRGACRALYERGALGQERPSARLQRARLALAGIAPRALRFRRLSAFYLYALYAWALFVLIAPTAWLAALTLPTRRLRQAAVHALCRSFLWAAGVRVSVSGREHLPDGGPCVVAANHASYLDAVILSAALKPGFLFIAKRELSANLLLGPVLRRLGTLFVERFDPVRGAEDAAELAAAARRGERLVIFPEGTLRRGPGLRPFRMGAFAAAAQAAAPMVPVVVRGSRSLLRAGQWFPRRGLLAVVIAPPLRAQGTDWNAALDLLSRTRTEILRSCGEPDLS